jgi:cellobiose-specific phosphotransferase system component IIA
MNDAGGTTTMIYTYGEKPSREQAEEAMKTLKAERFARWQSEMLPNEKDEIDNAHNLCIFLLREYINQLT